MKRKNSRFEEMETISHETFSTFNDVIDNLDFQIANRVENSYPINPDARFQQMIPAATLLLRKEKISKISTGPVRRLNAIELKSRLNISEEIEEDEEDQKYEPSKLPVESLSLNLKQEIPIGNIEVREAQIKLLPSTSRDLSVSQAEEIKDKYDWVKVREGPHQGYNIDILKEIAQSLNIKAKNYVKRDLARAIKRIIRERYNIDIEEMQREQGII